MFSGNGPKPIIADRHGTNAAIICPSCTRVFIVSATLDAGTGRTCPHCEMYHAEVADLAPGDKPLTPHLRSV